MRLLKHHFYNLTLHIPNIEANEEPLGAALTLPTTYLHSSLSFVYLKSSFLLFARKRKS